MFLNKLLLMIRMIFLKVPSEDQYNDTRVRGRETRWVRMNGTLLCAMHQHPTFILLWAVEITNTPTSVKLTFFVRGLSGGIYQNQLDTGRVLRNVKKSFRFRYSRSYWFRRISNHELQTTGINNARRSNQINFILIVRHWKLWLLFQAYSSHRYSKHIDVYKSACQFVQMRKTKYKQQRPSENKLT